LCMQDTPNADISAIHANDPRSPEQRGLSAYDELEPYYLQAEHLYQVLGERGEDPTEPSASGPYRYPAVSHEPRIQQLSDDLERLGLRPFHTPLGVMLDERNRRKSRCIRCATCDGHPCLVQAKSDAPSLLCRSCAGTSECHVETNSKVLRLETSGSGREVTKVIVEREGATEEYSADIVVLSCGAINSAALLLRSSNDAHPRVRPLGRPATRSPSTESLSIWRCSVPQPA
jgi:choline dehydrogenase-like flavoprotein